MRRDNCYKNFYEYYIDTKAEAVPLGLENGFFLNRKHLEFQIFKSNLFFFQKNDISIKSYTVSYCHRQHNGKILQDMWYVDQEASDNPKLKNAFESKCEAAEIEDQEEPISQSKPTRKMT